MSSDSFSAALGRLDPASRALLDLSLRRGMRPEEIADMLGADAESVAGSRDEALRRVAADVGMESEAELDQVRARLAELPAAEWLGAAAPRAARKEAAPAAVEEPVAAEAAEEPVAAAPERAAEPEAEAEPAAAERVPQPEPEAKPRRERERAPRAEAEPRPRRERERKPKREPEPEREPEPLPSPTARPADEPPKKAPLVRPGFLWALAGAVLLAGIAWLASLGTPETTEQATTTEQAKQFPPKGEPQPKPQTKPTTPTSKPKSKPKPKPKSKSKPKPKPKPKPAKAPVRLTAIARGASGTAQLTGGGRRLVLKLRGLPDPKSASYTVWLYSSVIEARALGAGRAGKIEIDAKLPGDWRKYRYVDVSREPTDGNPSHSGESVARVRTSALR